MIRHHTLFIVIIVAILICPSFNAASSYSQEVYQAQKALKELGYDPGPVGGIWGKETESAVKHFQVDKGLPVTGQLDDQTKEKLGIGPSDRGIKATPKSFERRLALVIGNGAYKNSPLKNPPNDAYDIAITLKKLGFEVIHEKNASHRVMEKAIRDFGKRLRKGGVGLFYFAGHGIQVNGRNYLVPVDAKIESESDVKFESVDAGRVLGKMEDAGNDLNIVILDACRDNPFARSFRTSSQGLARMDAPKGSLIAYATAPGSVAADGAGRNGIYTKYLLKHMVSPRLKIEDVLKKVRNDVMNETNDKQVPWESSSLRGDLYFNAQIQPSIINSTSPVSENILISSAWDAFYSGRYADPADDNTIEISRKVLRDDPNNTQAQELIDRAASAYENQAKMALSQGKQDLALKMYMRLFSLFPEREKYMKEALALKKPEIPNFVGSWHWSVASIFVPDRTNRIFADGTCKLDKLTGSWRVSDTNKRKFVFSWSDNWTHTMILSNDGKSMSGKDDWGTKVTGKKMD